MIRVLRLPAPAYLNVTDTDKWHRNLCSRREDYFRRLSQSLRNNQRRPTRPSADCTHYAHADVRAQLETMFGDKCAYCESNVTAVSPQHIEHYRPSARYPGLAYAWNNLLLACPHCNSTYKKDRFPISPAGNTPKENRTNPCRRTGTGETPLLLNPCHDNPDQHLTFHNGRVVALSREGRFTRRICGLNRDDLIRSRRMWLRFIQRSAESYKYAAAKGDIAALSKYAGELREFIDTTAPYAAMARAELDQFEINWRAL